MFILNEKELEKYGEDDYRYKICVIDAQNFENECQTRCMF